VQASVLTPLPGTRLFDKIKSEKRLLRTNYPHDWKRYHFVEVVHRPAKMSAQEFAAEVEKAYRITFSKFNIFKRFLRTWWNTRSLRTAVWAWHSNFNYRSLVMENPVEYPQEPTNLQA